MQIRLGLFKTSKKFYELELAPLEILLHLMNPAT